MSTYTTKTKVPESKQQFLDESSKQKKQTLLTIILIFFLILLLLFSVIISNKFTITSMDVRKSTKQLDFAYYEVGKGNLSQELPVISKESTQVQQTKVEESKTTTVVQETQKPITTSQTPVKTTTTDKNQIQTVTASEKKVGIDGKIITSKNIKEYHSLLLKEFEGKEIYTYKIIWGDTLWKIAMKFNTSAHTLYVLNALNNPDLIIAGNNLKVVKNFVLPKERTEKILSDAIKNKTSLNTNQKDHEIYLSYYFKFKSIFETHLTKYENLNISLIKLI